MQSVDANLLIALDALLSEGSVAGAARVLNLSPPATSRILARIRSAMDDQILVRAGRRLVPTLKALEIRDRVKAHAEEARHLLSAGPPVDLRKLTRTFHVRADDTLTGGFAVQLLRLLRQRAPNVRLSCLQRTNREATELRDGSVDIDIGVANNTAPEIKMQILYEDDFVGVVRTAHPILKRRMTAKAYAALTHVNASRQGLAASPIDKELKHIGLSRSVVLVVPSFWAAIGAVVNTDIATAVPRHFIKFSGMFSGLDSFPLPVTTPKIQLVQSWHPRWDNDPAHRWLRECVREVFNRTTKADQA